MNSTVALPDGLREALGQVIADQRREWRREREVIEAQSGQIIAELRAEVAGLRAQIAELQAELRAKIDARLAELKDGAPGERGADGKSVTIEDVLPAIESAIAARFAALPTPKDGRDGKDGEHGRSVTLAELEPIVDATVARAVAAIPAPKDGVDGRSVDVAAVEAMVAERVSVVVNEAVARAVAALPPAEPGAPGTSVTADDVAPLIATEVEKAVAALPKPKDGVDGKDGAPGERGLDGAPGKLPTIGEWKDRVYHESDVVTFAGSTYQAQRDTGKAPPHEDWRCIARAGNDGIDGRSLNFRSTWSADETYAALDVATLDGGSFVALRDDPGPCPGDGWRLFVQRGKAGRPGEKGDKGDRGTRGEPGPAVVGIEMDDEGVVILTNADGSTATGDFYPVLSRIGR